MQLILATGSNLGDRAQNLAKVIQELAKIPLVFIAKSSVVESEPVEYLDQPHFFNQVLEYEIPVKLDPPELLHKIKFIEKSMGRIPGIAKGPRLIDIDIIFWGELIYETQDLNIPHPQWKYRPFVYELLKELPSWKKGNNNGFFSLK
jgi:2-amino-4-hydroxy-6-hydroxymethyldihydropteridine diphosphokinase